MDLAHHTTKLYDSEHHHAGGWGGGEHTDTHTQKASSSISCCEKWEEEMALNLFISPSFEGLPLSTVSQTYSTCGGGAFDRTGEHRGYLSHTHRSPPSPTQKKKEKRRAKFHSQ